MQYIYNLFWNKPFSKKQNENEEITNSKLG